MSWYLIGKILIYFSIILAFCFYGWFVRAVSELDKTKEDYWTDQRECVDCGCFLSEGGVRTFPGPWRCFPCFERKNQ